ncbi:MAG: DUF2142 domain-containing protein [Acidobacteriaceae bacterium]|nr:DUF2142 domain-containing protein [Acidobacteriaceae bacterium]
MINELQSIGASATTMKPVNEHRENRSQNASSWLPLAVVMACTGLLLITWAFAVPIFESPDEPHHWKNAEYIHSHFALPPYTSDFLEAPQAPLYYVLVAPLASSSAIPPILKHKDNERALGYPLANIPGFQVAVPCWPHFFANCPQDLHRYWPIRLVRLATGLFALIAVLFTALAVLEITGSQWSAATAAALIGFLPQFDFRGASVNNDPAVVCFSAIVTYFIVRMAMRGFERTPAVCASIALGLAFLSKISAAVLVPVFLASILIVSPDWRCRIRRSLLLLISGAIILPWLVRNQLVLGDFLGTKKMGQMVPMMRFPRSITDPYFHTTFLQLTSRSFFGYFGWLTIKMPGLTYRIYLLIFVVAAAGVVLILLRRGKSIRVVFLLGSVAILSFCFLLYASLNYPQPQGRLLYPALSAIMILAAVGLGAILSLRKYMAVTVALVCLSINVYALTRIIYPLYWLDKPTCWSCAER